MGRLYLVKLDGEIYSCRFCRSHLTNAEELVSKAGTNRAHDECTFRSSVAAKGRLTCSTQYKFQFSRNSWHLLICKILLRYTVHSRHELVNVFAGPIEERMMTSGMHTVCDIYCSCCHQIVGWKYERAYEKKQKFKEGKFVLELARVAGGDSTEFYSESNLDSHDA